MRVILADPQAAVRSALRLLITQESDMQVVGEVAEAAQLWPRLDEARPELLLVDWALLGTRAYATMARLHARYPGVQVIVLSGRPEARQEALAAGAAGFVSKGDAPGRLLAMLRTVQARRNAGNTAACNDAQTEDAHD